MADLADLLDESDLRRKQERENMRSLMLIDLSGIFWANWHATADKQVSEAFERTVAKVHSLRTGYDHVACCIDMPPYFRKIISPTYKAQRDAPAPQAVEQFARVKERLEADGVLLLGAKSYEADDIAATIVAANLGASIVLASADKDWAQLVSDELDVRLLSTMSGVMYDREKVIEKHGVSPDMMRDWLSMVGDKSDNVPGVPGVGPVTAAKLLMQYGTLHEVLANADKQKPALCEALILHGKAALLAQQLVTLKTDAPINLGSLFEERKAKPLTTKDYEAEGFERGDATEDDDGEVPISGPPKPPSEPKNEAPPAPRVAPAPVTEVVRSAPQQTAIVVPAPQQDWSLQLEPRTIDGAFKLARGLHESRLYSSKFASPEAIMTVMIRGREMGIPALVALDVFHFFEGKLALHAHLIVARAQALSECEYFTLVSSSGAFAEYVTKHRQHPEPTRLRYTIEQAKQAGLCPENPRTRRVPGEEKDRRGNWEKRPDEMLRKTCATQLIRIVYPDAALGIYAIEELEGAA